MKPVVYVLIILQLSLISPSLTNWSKPRPDQNERRSSIPDLKIIGGDEIQPHSAPYQAGVLINGTSLCGGSLISATTVLTAAHCTLDASFVVVVLGAHVINTAESTQLRMNSSSFVVHEEYPHVLQKDLSIIFLPYPVILTDAIQTIPLAPASAPTYEHSSALLTGWGMTADNTDISSVLRGVNLTIISNEECNARYHIIQTYNVCTSGDGVVGACHSDSGGALVVDGIQVGIVSFGSSSCVDGSPTAFVRVSSFRGWIEENGGV